MEMPFWLLSSKYHIYNCYHVQRLPLKFRQNAEPRQYQGAAALLPVVLNAKGDQWALWSEWPLGNFCVWAICCDIRCYLFSAGSRHPPLYTWMKFWCISLLWLLLRLPLTTITWFLKITFPKIRITLSHCWFLNTIFMSQYLGHKLIFFKVFFY